MRLAGLTLLLVALLPIAAARATTVEVDSPGSVRAGTADHKLEVRGGSGEANQLRVVWDGSLTQWRVTDTAPLTAGDGCSLDVGAVVCAVPAGRSRAALVDLGDGNDELVVEGFQGGFAEVLDGDGDDEVTLSAGTGGGEIVAGAGADQYTSQEEKATLSYAQRSRGVKVDLNGAADDGEPGENDNVGGGFHVTGSTHADEMRAGSAAVSFDGYSGDDRIVGGPGDDVINSNGAGAASIRGGAGNDRLSVARTDPGGVVSGGEGHDVLQLKGNAIHGIVSTYVDVTLDGVANDGPEGGTRNVLPDFEQVSIHTGRLVGSDGPETLSGTDVDGRGGADVVSGDGVLVGGPGRDRLSYAASPLHPDGGVRAQDGESDVIECLSPPPTFEVDAVDNVEKCARAAAPPRAFGALAPMRKTTRLDRRGRAVLRLRCAANSPIPCTGNASIRLGKGKGTVIATASFRDIAPGKSKPIGFKIATRWRRALARGRNVSGSLVAHTTQTGTAELRTAILAGKVTIKPRRR